MFSSNHSVSKFVHILIFLTTPCFGQTSTGWPSAGYDINNSRWASQETILNNQNVSNLAVKWTFTTGDDVSATPSVDPTGSYVYFPDWAGFLYKVDTSTGQAVWSNNMTAYGLPAPTISRTTPTLSGSTVVFGASSTLTNPNSNGAFLLDVDATTGNLIWKTQLDANPNSLVTGSPIVYNGIAYVTLSSNEEKLANPTFQGSLIAVSMANGQILWQTFFAPAGYTGVPVWSSTPVIDTVNSQIFVTTGNNYLVPPSVQTCEQHAKGNPGAILACQDPTNYEDSVVALDLATGNIKWGKRCSADDAWLFACKTQSPGCPNPAGKDWDFGSGANLFTANVNGVPTLLIGAGQKSGIYWAFNAATGATVWKTQVGPGGVAGGIQWGTATDGQRIYVAISNSNYTSYILQPSGVTWHGASWAALDPATGKILWQVKDPGFNTTNPSLHALAMGPVSVANGVVYVGSMSAHMYALDAATGNTLWSFLAQGSVNAAPAIVNGVLYWGSGYHYFPGGHPIGTGSHTFYAFSLPAPGAAKVAKK